MWGAGTANRHIVTPVKRRVFGNYPTPSRKRKRDDYSDIDSAIGNSPLANKGVKKRKLSHVPSPLVTMKHHVKSTVHGRKAEESKSSTRFRNRKSYHRSKYEKINCSHGVFADHLTYQIDSGTGVVGMGYLARPSTAVASNALNIHHFGMKTVMQMQLYKNGFQERLNSTAGNNLAQVGGDKSGDITTKSESLVECVGWNELHRFVNVNKHRCQLQLIELIAKDTFPIVQATKQGDPIQMFNLDASYFNHTAASLNPTDPDWNIFKAQKTRLSWGLVKNTVVHMEPGQEHKHYVSFKPHYVIDEAKLYTNGHTPDANQDWVIKGVTTVTLYRINGGPVHVALDATNITLDGARLDVTSQLKMYMRQVTPFKDFFTWHLTTGWTETTKALVETVEEHVPTVTPGV